MNTKLNMNRMLPLFLTAILLAGPQAFADGDAQPAPLSPEMQAMMDKFKEAGAPSEGHRQLDSLVGSWDAAVKWWMAPDAPPEESIGNAEAQWILDGKFLEQKFSGISMGKPFNGIWITGFDNIAKKYQTVWMDDMATGMSIGSGTYDPASKTITDKGSFSCPITWGERTYRSEIKWTEGGGYTYQMYVTDPKTNQEFKNMEIVYTKKLDS